ncbi:MAG: dephospho-CoA kinase [Clostridia bacterium]|nr:dephospho-CoA kinase [Clostridia bacterium]
MKQTVIGITGGTGCGKTTALHALAELGFHLIDCDALYHHLLDTDREMLDAIEAAFPGVLLNGKLQRKLLGQRVFSNTVALDKLNQTVWPYVNKAVERQLRDKAPQPCAIDAIGLLESGLGALCTCTVAVTAPEESRVARLMAREGISEEYARLRIQAQKPNDVFAASCGVTIHNSFDSAELFLAHCKETFQQLLKEDVQP